MVTKFTYARYSPYGYFKCPSACSPILAFCGEHKDIVADFYLLGNGRRAFLPRIMRFNRPDNASPFGAGGLNTYGYCQGDPINFHDPSGRTRDSILKSWVDKKIYIVRDFYRKPPSPRKRSPSMSSLNTSPQKDESLGEWNRIGYHGGLAENSQSLTSALKDEFANSVSLLGRGFYSSPDERHATFYTRDFESRGRKGQLFGVYAWNFRGFKPGRDYVFGLTTEPTLEVVIRERAYSKVHVRVEEVRDIKRLIYPLSHEAPF